MASCEDIHVPLPGDTWQFVAGQSNRNRYQWSNSVGDRLSLAHLPPFDSQLRRIFADPAQIPRYYHEGFNHARRGLVECKLCQVDQQGAVYVIGKQASISASNGHRQAQGGIHGITYLGLITIPLRAESFVFSLACSEHGITGIREAMVSEKLLAGGLELGPQMWFDDPFDPTACEPYRRSLSDAARYDYHFPEHPLARLRRYLHSLIRNVSLSKAVESATISSRILAQFRRL